MSTGRDIAKMIFGIRPDAVLDVGDQMSECQQCLVAPEEALDIVRRLDRRLEKTSGQTSKVPSALIHITGRDSEARRQFFRNGRLSGLAFSIILDWVGNYKPAVALVQWAGSILCRSISAGETVRSIPTTPEVESGIAAYGTSPEAVVEALASEQRYSESVLLTAGIHRLTVWRGIRDEPAQRIASIKRDGLAAVLPTRFGASFSLSREVAEGSAGRDGVVITLDIRPDDVLTSIITNQAFSGLFESEVLVYCPEFVRIRPESIFVHL